MGGEFEPIGLLALPCRIVSLDPRRRYVLMPSSSGRGRISLRASPRLKDATSELDSHRLAELYAELVLIMRIMYQRCKLVHADLSEYNILFVFLATLLPPFTLFFTHSSPKT
jgi:hypothetical protein